jgi:hypothetical protein
LSQVGRNDPCPCGSGKKYKKCCLAGSYAEVGREESARRRLIERLLEFFNKFYREALPEALEIFWGDFVPEEHLKDHPLEIAYQNFFEWVTFDFVIDDVEEKTLIDLYMKQHKCLSGEEHRVLTMMKNSVISLYEVEEVFPGRGLLLKDLLIGGEYDVKEKAATQGLRKWDIFAARLLLIDGQYILSGSVYPYDLGRKQEILDTIHQEFREYQNAFPDATFDMFLKESGDIFNYCWYLPFLSPMPLNLHTTTGEPFLFGKAFFEIRDNESVRKGLQSIKGFEKEDDHYVWIDTRKEGSATILGRVEIQGGRLILECNSKKRLERGKKLILKAIGDAIIHKLDSFQDPFEALKEYKKKPLEPEDELPIEIQQQMYTEFMQKRYEKWFREKIPALDGKTPLGSMKTGEGRQKVIELLKLYENGEERNKLEGRPFYDLGWVWERLGLKKEEL